MKLEGIGESVIVGAVFGSPSTVRPAWFIWNGKRYDIEETNFTWVERKGRTSLHHFAVSDGADIFELILNAETLTWRLEQVETPG